MVGIPVALLVRLILGHGTRGLLVTALISLSYETVCVARWGQTLGKHIAGTRVVALPTGDSPTAHQAVRRALVVTIPTLVLMLPGRAILRVFLVNAMALAIYWPLFQAGERRGLHDRFAGTIVVPSQ
jgi:uncharacterized RDD family membrane protein YckC